MAWNRAQNTQLEHPAETPIVQSETPIIQTQARHRTKGKFGAQSTTEDPSHLGNLLELQVFARHYSIICYYL